MNAPINICPICSRKILRNSHTAFCQCCQRKVHKNCTSPSQDDFVYIQSSRTWIYRLCNERIFLFNHIESDNEFTVTLDQFMGYALISGAEFQPPDTMIFDLSDINEMEDHIIEYHGELDPDSNYFNQFSHRLNKSSNYYVSQSVSQFIDVWNSVT